MATINLPQCRPRYFSTDELKEHIRKSNWDFIIIGQQQCTLIDHTKPNSLDYWLRKKYNPDQRQALNRVIDDLVTTGEFERGRFQCPDSGRICKGIRIVK
jgi:hypothetical protein